VDRKQLVIQHVTFRPLQLPVVKKVAAWLEVPAIRESFVPAFPENEDELHKYFIDPTREYFGIYYNEQPMGMVGDENIDPTAGKLEMRSWWVNPDCRAKALGNGRRSDSFIMLS
jgi:hypothetical protein